jgi:hypothetical protein
MSQRTQIFIDDGLLETFASGAYREVDAGTPLTFPLSIIWWESSAKTQKIVELTVTRNAAQSPTTLEWKVYATDGTTVTQTVTDTITYTSDVFEATRTRVIT